VGGGGGQNLRVKGKNQGGGGGTSATYTAVVAKDPSAPVLALRANALTECGGRKKKERKGRGRTQVWYVARPNQSLAQQVRQQGGRRGKKKKRERETGANSPTRFPATRCFLTKTLNTVRQYSPVLSITTCGGKKGRKKEKKKKKERREI